MASTVIAWKKQKPGEIRWATQPTQRPGQYPRRAMNYGQNGPTKKKTVLWNLVAPATKHQPLPSTVHRSTLLNRQIRLL